MNQVELNDIFIQHITKGNIPLAQHYIAQGADIHALNDWALRHCSKDGLFEATEFLLLQGADVHALHDWALNQASKRGHLNIVQLLIDYGADIYSNEESVLFHLAKHSGSENLIHSLLDKGLNPALHDDLLYDITILGSLSLVQRLLKAGLFEATDILLYCAIEHDHLHLFQYFTEIGYNHYSQEIVLSIAVEKKSLNMAQFLIQAGGIITTDLIIKSMRENHLKMTELLLSHTILNSQAEDLLVKELLKRKDPDFIHLFIQYSIPFNEHIKPLVKNFCLYKEWDLLISLYHYYDNKKEIWKFIKQYSKGDFLEQITHYHQQYLLVNQLEKSLPFHLSSSKNKL